MTAAGPSRAISVSFSLRRVRLSSAAAVASVIARFALWMLLQRCLQRFETAIVGYDPAHPRYVERGIEPVDKGIKRIESEQFLNEQGERRGAAGLLIVIDVRRRPSAAWGR